ncbi:zinc-dependent metalloprotease [Nocardioides daejeonensis]|uniref:zinc-dependent metalloprotease n=1 Tax=Nocardioides daejeonensis TaxID=1046556 RepID=UPI000D747947|nr:zinc-dependent metalloprotease [Nocardioides daejeonensis]
MSDAGTEGFIDWETAVRVGSRLVGDGPAANRDEAKRAVEQLRAGAHRSTGLVREFTGLEAPEGTAPILVVDRPSWVRANADSFQTVLGPVVSAVMAKRKPGAATKAIGSRITGAEIGLLLGFMGSRVLGQFDPFHQPHGRLLLVAPNVVHVERELQADPTDFRLWVCLHEETHRVQFTAVPWMRDHLLAQVERLAETMVPDQEALEEGLRSALTALRGGSLMDAISSPEQREVIDQVTGMMSLLEGHADVVMDGVGPEVIPSVAEIRRKFTVRRKGIGPLDRILRRLLGLDAKMAQYRDGAAFVRHVVDKVGMADFNAVWSGPEHLPSKDEIHDPDAWISRVHG